MPLFEYRCARCDASFETLVARADDPAPECPRCGAPGARRQWSVFAVAKSTAARAAGPCGSADCACRSRQEQ